MAPLKTCRVGTRKSALARTQSGWVAAQLEKRGYTCSLVDIVSHGDTDRANPLYAIESDSPGLFCKQLEEALLEGRIDIAVHSLKDLPTTQPVGLYVAAIPVREVADDCLLIHPSALAQNEILQLKHGARVGTSSLRREAQLLDARPDLRVESLRGNVPSRVDQVRNGILDAAVLARAGLRRLKLDLAGISAVALDPTRFIPAPAQGALAIETRLDAPLGLRECLAELNDSATQTAVQIERQIMKDLEGGCTLPLGVLCSPIASGGWHVHAFLGEAKNRQEARRDWVCYHRFDILGTDAQTLVAKTVQYFKGR